MYYWLGYQAEANASASGSSICFANQLRCLEILTSGSHSNFHKIKQHQKLALFYLAGVPGFEPGNARTKTVCLTTWRYPIVQILLTCSRWFLAMLRPARSLVHKISFLKLSLNLRVRDRLRRYTPKPCSPLGPSEGLVGTHLTQIAYRKSVVLARLRERLCAIIFLYS